MDVRVGQKREQEQAEGVRGRVTPESITIREEDGGRFRVVKRDGRTSWLLRESILRRYPVVLEDAPPGPSEHDALRAAGMFACGDDCKPLTPAEASAIQDVAEVEALRREVETLRRNLADAQKDASEEAAECERLRAEVEEWKAKATAARDGALAMAIEEVSAYAENEREAASGAVSESARLEHRSKALGGEYISKVLEDLKASKSEPVFTAAQVREAVAKSETDSRRITDRSAVVREIRERLGLKR